VKSAIIGKKAPARNSFVVENQEKSVLAAPHGAYHNTKVPPRWGLKHWLLIFLQSYRPVGSHYQYKSMIND